MELHGSSSSYTCLSNREIEVCKILLNLKKQIRQFDSIPPNLHWVGKKLRTRMHFIPNPDPMRHIRSPSLSTGEKRAEASPDKPLGLSTSQDDQKLDQYHPKISKKRTIDDLLKKLHGLEQNKKLLIGTLETVKNSHSKLKALNLELKGKTKQLQYPPFENQDQTQLDHLHNYQQSNTDSGVPTGQVNTFSKASCNQKSIKVPLDIDLNAPLPLECVEEEWR